MHVFTTRNVPESVSASRCCCTSFTNRGRRQEQHFTFPIYPPLGSHLHFFAWTKTRPIFVARLRVDVLADAGGADHVIESLGSRLTHAFGYQIYSNDEHVNACHPLPGRRPPSFRCSVAGRRAQRLAHLIGSPDACLGPSHQQASRDRARGRAFQHGHGLRSRSAGFGTCVQRGGQPRSGRRRAKWPVQAIYSGWDGASSHLHWPCMAPPCEENGLS